MVQHLQPRCLEDRFLPQQTRKKKGTAKAKSLQRSISHLPVVLKLPSNLLSWLKRSIDKQLRAQGPCLHGNLTPACPNCFAPQPPKKKVQDIVLPFPTIRENHVQHAQLSHGARCASQKDDTSQTPDSGNIAEEHHKSLAADPHFCSERFSASGLLWWIAQRASRT